MKRLSLTDFDKRVLLDIQNNPKMWHNYWRDLQDSQKARPTRLLSNNLGYRVGYDYVTGGYFDLPVILPVHFQVTDNLYPLFRATSYTI